MKAIGIGGAGSKIAVVWDPSAVTVNVSEVELNKVNTEGTKILAALRGASGIFKGALKCRAKAITEPMKHAAARALAALVPESELSPTNIIPDVFAPGVADAVAAAVIAARCASNDISRDA